MRKILFIINPAAGSGKAEAALPSIQKAMDKYNIEYRIEKTTMPKDGTRIAEENADRFDTIVAVGGDGTVNEVAKGLIMKGQGILGILPCGTGNDFAKVLGISEDVNHALNIIINGRAKQVDIGRVNDNQIINIASVGFDTEVVIMNNTVKRLIKGKISYIISVFITMLNYRKKNFKITIDGVDYFRNTLLLAFGKGRFYGGGLEILPTSELDDGYLHVCLVKDATNIKLLLLFPSIFKANHVRYTKYVEMYKAKEIIIHNNEKINLNIDGEIFQVDADIDISLDEFKLNVLANK